MMQRRDVLATGATLALTAMPGIGLAARRDPVVDAGFDPVRLAKLRAHMQGLVDRGVLPGVAYTVARHGGAIDTVAIGKADLDTGMALRPDTIVRIASMTKPIVGVAMMTLFEEGRWHLDDPVTQYVPEFATLRVATGVDAKGAIETEPMRRPPTMRELMSHSAGFGYGLSDIDPVDKLFRSRGVGQSTSLRQLIERVATIPLMYQPGTRWSYSIAVDVQGYIIEKLSGMTLGRFLRERVLTPLRMNDTGFVISPEQATRLAALYASDPVGRLIPAASVPGRPPMGDPTRPPRLENGGGGLMSTLNDYSRFCQMLLNGGELDGARVLAPQTVELMGTNVLPANVSVTMNGTTAIRYNEHVGFGLDFSVIDEPRRAGSLEGAGVMAWGGAFGTWFWVDRANDLYFVGVIQRGGPLPGEDIRANARVLTYQALVRPEK